MRSYLKPYPTYKDSGVPWLEGVPVHWDVRRGKWLFRHRKELNTNRRNANVLSLTLRGVVNNDPENPEGLVPKDYATYQLFRKGDLVFKLIDLENLRTSRVGLVHEDGIMSSAYVRLTSHSAGDIRFFFRQYFDLYQRGIYNQLGAGVRSTLGPSDLLDLSLVVPQIPEQTAIVRFLDFVDRRIQRSIHVKQKQIKLLEEQKQAVIHRGVTRGLDPNVRLKSSGVAWLGDIPEHWSVGRLSQFFTLQRGFDITKDTQRQGLIPVVSSGGVASFHDIGTSQGPGVLVGRKGTAGAVHFIEGEYWAHDTTLWVNDFKGNVPRFIYHLLTILDLKRFDTGSANPTLNRNLIHPERVAFPPSDEQMEIATQIDLDLASLEGSVVRGNRSITLLREYRTRLISDVVTGKLDVREVAANLPEENDDDTPLVDVALEDVSEGAEELAHELEEVEA